MSHGWWVARFLGGIQGPSRSCLELLGATETLLTPESGSHTLYSAWVVLLSSDYILGFLDKER